MKRGATWHGKAGAIGTSKQFWLPSDQYAEAATRNREYFLNKPHSIGGSRKNGDAP
jgi:hypothetical protein